MSVWAHIQDPTNENSAQVTDDRALRVSVQPASASELSDDTLTRNKLLREFFTDSTGSRDLNVDGSATPVEFVVASEPDRVKRITAVRFILDGTTMEIDTVNFRRFGPATAVNTPLANGIDFEVQQGGVTTEIFAEPVTILGEFLDWADGFVSLANAVGAQEDFISFDFEFHEPIVLPTGNTDKIVVRINDDLTNVFLFHVVVFHGSQELTS